MSYILAFFACLNAVVAFRFLSAGNPIGLANILGGLAAFFVLISCQQSLGRLK